MKAVTAQWIADVVGGQLQADPAALVTSVSKDSRAVEVGALYVAISGERVDGHDFASQALASGASVALVSRPVDGPHIQVSDTVAALGLMAKAYLALLRAESEVTVIGITGSNGKTTTKDLAAQILPEAVAPQGSFNNEIGLPLTVLEADLTTRHLVLEMGASAPGDIAYLTDIAPLDIAVVLTVGTAHMLHYPSPSQLAEEKESILAGLVPNGQAILNIDDPLVAAMATRVRAAGAKVTTYGLSAYADLAAEDLSLESGRARFTARFGGQGARVLLNLVGEHHAHNALAALAIAIACGQDLPEAAVAIGSAGPLSPHRMALTVREDGVRILDDAYNASPESMRAALRALLAVAEGGFTWAVVGEMREMGDASRAAHESIGKDAVRLNIGRLVVVGTGAKPAFDAALLEGSWGDEAVFVANIDEARELITSQWSPGDTVLVKASHGANLWRLADELIAAS